MPIDAHNQVGSSVISQEATLITGQVYIIPLMKVDES